ncbi:hypothetical protein DYB30_007776 [Aphanomyces astaci]|uniref:RING-type domain-containing protein n=2 Tax=Aphanomyces astaci TaxID=112090 RepID=A0A397DAA0_APHAT|nr:hypothetical protein DYB36_007684 [Aphanomyces astaci]RHY51619.1 hypothetical protein DYB30_007776 [Aphanomyces astaci]RHY58390.1 hypothetical protein DYB38_006883 [Aphanomyces astaci]RHZ14188.1 hypothetical protein DYB26_011942 [Aphanomyces astaci]RHZ31758.1 hypothetical protein DYB31_011508 [Aphanomyces astaci]
MNQQPMTLSRRCVVCKGMDAIILLEGCGHAFHSRCVFEWPLRTCEVCQTPCDSIALVGRCRRMPTSPTSPTMSCRRNWDEVEREYCMLLLDLFKEGSLPLKPGMHLRQTLAMLLNCNPMRITKKFKRQDTLGKQRYAYHATPTGATYKRHVQRQKQLSTLRDAFYWQLKLQSGRAMDSMREAETEFWLTHLVAFASSVGQVISSKIVVVPSTPPTPLPREQKHSVTMKVESPMAIECAVEQYMPCMSQMEWEIMEDLKSQCGIDPLPWSGHSLLYDELGSNDSLGSFLLDKVTVDDTIWHF